MQDRVQESRSPIGERVLVIVDPSRRCISHHHVHALTNEFPSVDVRYVDDLAQACGDFGRPVALLLVDALMCDALRHALAGVQLRHPRATITLLQEDERSAISLQTVRSFPVDVGVLPMNIKLDVWLAAVRIMLMGGHYFPAALLRCGAAAPAELAAAASLPISPSTEPPRSEAAQPQARTLTSREEQILEMVSQGLQNKIIASTLGLSEHTVKLHLHKIISKLGVHNRTEAAVSFLGRRAPYKAPLPGGEATADRPPA